jgi:transcriptional regulator with XRE-family HTH domain
MKESFGEKFTRLRKAKGLTQEDIASSLNVTSQAVSKWENDISFPDITLLVQISEIFGVSVDDLLGKESIISMVSAEARKDISKMILRIFVNSHEGDKVKVNLPMALIKVALDSKIAIPQIKSNGALKDIDFNQILELVEQGVIGKLVEVESSDGDIVEIYVE